MITFDFSGAGNAGGGAFESTTQFTAPTPAPGFGLFENTMTFIVTVSAPLADAFMNAQFNTFNGVGFFASYTQSMSLVPGTGTEVRISFSDGAQPVSFATAAIDTSFRGGMDIFWITAASSSITAVDGVVQGGGIVGIRFVPTAGFSDVAVLSLTGTPTCFAEGTGIATPEGARAVETLEIGDEILTADGGTIPVKWIGRQSFDTRFGVPERRRPVRIAAGALGGGLPQRDLVVTSDHAMLIEGVMVQAGALLDLPGVTRATDMKEQFAVYHIETEGHQVILAEGAPTESFIDYAGRGQFDNYAEYVALYGADEVLAEQSLPRITHAAQLPEALKEQIMRPKAA